MSGPAGVEDTGSGQIDAVNGDTGADSIDTGTPVVGDTGTLVVGDTGTPVVGDTGNQPANVGGAARMTGGGAFTDEGSHRQYNDGFTVHCLFTHDTDSMELNWGTDDFHLLGVYEVDCYDTPGVDEGQPQVGWDTVEGTGWGRLSDGTQVDIWFLLIDDGEPGKGRDTVWFRIDPGTPNEIEASGYLQRGNNQAHGALPQ